MFPIWQTAGQKEEQEALGAGAARFMDLALEDARLLTEERIFEDQLPFQGREVGREGKHMRRLRPLSEMKKDQFEKGERALKELGEEGAGPGNRLRVELSKPTVPICAPSCEE